MDTYKEHIRKLDPHVDEEHVLDIADELFRYFGEMSDADWRECIGMARPKPSAGGVDPAHYDGQIHTVACESGAHFRAKYDAYRADGFMVKLLENSRGFLAVKEMRA